MSCFFTQDDRFFPRNVGTRWVCLTVVTRFALLVKNILEKGEILCYEAEKQALAMSQQKKAKTA
jgi:hypothetical protein